MVIDTEDAEFVGLYWVGVETGAGQNILRALLYFMTLQVIVRWSFIIIIDLLAHHATNLLLLQMGE